MESQSHSVLGTSLLKWLPKSPKSDENHPESSTKCFAEGTSFMDGGRSYIYLFGTMKSIGTTSEGVFLLSCKSKQAVKPARLFQFMRSKNFDYLLLSNN